MYGMPALRQIFYV